MQIFWAEQEVEETKEFREIREFIAHLPNLPKPICSQSPAIYPLRRNSARTIPVAIATLSDSEVGVSIG